jgi:hypothetical protein
MRQGDPTKESGFTAPPAPHPDDRGKPKRASGISEREALNLLLNNTPAKQKHQEAYRVVSRALAERDALREALEAVDKEALVAQDAIWSPEVTAAQILHDKSRDDSAGEAIWRLHVIACAALERHP